MSPLGDLQKAAMSRMIVGADGCPFGWFVTVIEDGTVHTDTYERFEPINETYADADRILVDVPIGLPTDSRRQCDEEASDLLGCRGNSVFYPPTENAIKHDEYDRANEAQRGSTENGLSQQAFHIRQKIREVREVVGDQFDGLVRESHPELCFAALNGQPISYPKTSKLGRSFRLQLLTEALEGADAETIYRRVREEYFLKNVRRDDILDAMVLAVAAGTQSLTTVPKKPSKAQPRIYYPHFELPSLDVP